MKRLLLAILSMCVIFLVAPSVEARGGNQMEYVLYSRTVQNPVEQETDSPWGNDPSAWVLNPFTNCAWDLDDGSSWLAHGALRAGEALVMSECTIASQTPFWMTINGNEGWWSWSLGWYGVQVHSDIPGVVVEICYQPEGRCFTPTPTYVAATKMWEYNSCTQAAFAPEDPMLTVIPGSQGGVGVIQTVTTTIRNPTGRNARSVDSTVGAVGAYGWGSYNGCTGGTVQQDYPFQYTG